MHTKSQSHQHFVDTVSEHQTWGSASLHSCCFSPLSFSSLASANTFSTPLAVSMFRRHFGTSSPSAGCGHDSSPNTSSVNCSASSSTGGDFSLNSFSVSCSATPSTKRAWSSDSLSVSCSASFLTTGIFVFRQWALMALGRGLAWVRLLV